MTPSKALPSPAASSWLQSLPIRKLGELAVPLAMLAIVVALITPLPSFLLDLLIVADILISVTVMMVSLYLVRPVEFTSFPTTLLLLTLFRLALNISSSRLILLNGNTGTAATVLPVVRVWRKDGEEAWVEQLLSAQSGDTSAIGEVEERCAVAFGG